MGLGLKRFPSNPVGFFRLALQPARQNLFVWNVWEDDQCLNLLVRRQVQLTDKSLKQRIFFLSQRFSIILDQQQLRGGRGLV